MKKLRYFFNILMIFALFCAIFSPSKFLKTSHASSIEPNFTNLIVFARFDGESEFVNTSCGENLSVLQLFENSYSLANYSVKDYFYCASNGKVNMQNVYLFNTDGGSLVLSNSRGYYSKKSDSNQNGYEQSEYELRFNALKQDWSGAINSAIANGCAITNANKSQTYAISDLDKNGDGYIDNITIIYKYSTEYSTSWKDCLWTYQAYCDMVELSSGAKTLTSKSYVQLSYDYSFHYSVDEDSTQIANLKTIIHETGHVFGLKDLYNTAGNTPVYYMSIMSAQGISQVPQYISAKEREALGWLSSNNVRTINSAGTYTINVTTSEPTSNVVCYKLTIPSKNKMLYLEYRKFDGTANKYDTLSKVIHDKNGTALKSVNVKSGLVCFLIDANTELPNNMYCNSYSWNYQVLGGTNQTKNDSALANGESLPISSNLSVEVTSLTDSTLTFKIVGTDISSEHVHSLTNVKRKEATCTQEGNIEYNYCTSCNKYFLPNGTEILLSDTVIAKIAHTPQKVDGKDATCTQEGLTDGSKCSVCGQILQAQQTISKKPHTSGDWILDYDSTTTTTGKRHKECINCGTQTEEQTIPKKTTPQEPDPSTPTAPSKPTEPSNPSDPSEPTNPTTPSEPNNNSASANGTVLILVFLAGIPACFVVIAVALILRRKR